MKRLELSTLSLARRCSTTELHPQRAGGPHAWVSSMNHGGDICQQPTATGYREAADNTPMRLAISRASRP